MGFRFGWLTVTCALALCVACDGDGDVDAGTDAGGSADAGCEMIPGLPTGDRPDPSAVTCPDDPAVPNPEEQMGSCCYRQTNSDRLAEPEMRLTFIDIVGPVGSPLASQTVRRVLNESVQEERFNWLIRVEDAGADGDVNILTGFGRRVAADGTYVFSTGAAESDPDEWCPVDIPATLTGESLAADPVAGSITVPVFDEAGTTIQIELTLRNLAIDTAEMGEDRSCIGWKVGRPFTYLPQGVISGYVEVEPSRTQTIMTTALETTVCSALAGSLSLTYCDENTQDQWIVQPDSLCDASGCTANTACGSDVCDPATTCNAWRFVANFAAAGVDITNSRCGG